MNLSIAAASVLALKPLLTRILPWLFRSNKGSPGPSENGSMVDAASEALSLQASEEPLSFAEFAFLARDKKLSIATMAQPTGDVEGDERQSRRGTNFGFVEIQVLQPLTQLTPKETIKPLLNMAPLFFFCGVIYSFNNILDFEGQSQGKTDG